MADKYLFLARRGKNQWWRYLSAITLILISWLVIGNIPALALILLVFYDGNEQTNFNSQINQFEGIDLLWNYLVIHFAFIAFVVALYIAVRFIHQRSFISLITPRNEVRISRIIQGFLLWAILLGIAGAIEYALFPQTYQLTYNPQKFLIFLPFALILTPIQTSVEELFFRGYLMQSFGLITRIASIPVLFSSLIFAAVHFGNPEVGANFLILAIFYLVLALFLAVITLKDNSLELALGVHAANNLFTVLLVNPTNSALPAYAVFSYNLNPVYTLVSYAIAAIVFYMILCRGKAKPKKAPEIPNIQETQIRRKPQKSN
ncbi:lysostaphin resistance A-like protein [Aerosakkonemataceae cyanobacterium BLCC-F154]|uniref:Lysostaphin resistance A-like protein n=1 Tax=Floridaenema fluviatile BLCC-F154 TaxID=3153640 RepID=A0ABV4YJ39_9CYAN